MKLISGPLGISVRKAASRKRSVHIDRHQLCFDRKAEGPGVCLFNFGYRYRTLRQTL